LSAPDAERYETTENAVAMHSMKQAGGQNRSGCTDRMSMRDRSAVHVHDILGQAELLDDGQHNRREGFIDLRALDIPELPAGPLEGLTHSRHRSETEHPGFDRTHAVRDKARHRHQAALLAPIRVSDDHCGGARIKARSVAGRNGAVLPKGRPEGCRAPPVSYPAYCARPL